MDKVWVAGVILLTGIASAAAGAIAAKENVAPMAAAWVAKSPNPALITGKPLCDPDKGFFEGLMVKGEYDHDAVGVSDTNVVVRWYVNRHTKEWVMITFTPADRMYCVSATGTGFFTLR